MKIVNIKTILFGLLLVFSAATLSAQVPAAEVQYGHYSYQDAIKSYKKIVKKDKTNGEVLFNLANAYRLNGNPQEAEVWFAEAVLHSQKPETKLYFAQTLLSNKKYSKAQKWFENYSVVAENPDDVQTAKSMAAFCAQLAAEGEPQYLYEVHEVSFNTEAFEFSPTFYADSAIVFVSNRDYPGNKKRSKDKWTGQHYMELFYANKQDNGAFGTPEKFLVKTDAYYHEGPAVFTKERDVIYYTKNQSERKNRNFDENRNTRLGIYRSQLSDGQWSAPAALNFVNEKFTVCHPALSKDADFMIFASDMPGGYGGSDLYIAYTDGGAWSVPENLGNEINTAGNEVFPHIDAYNNLYFSSDMHIGFGGLDIFKCFFEDKGKWSFPENFGVPVNTSRDDFGFAISADWYTGYFTSNRKGDDNIYTFEANEDMIVTHADLFNPDYRPDGDGTGTTTKPGKNGKPGKKITKTAPDKLYVCGTVINRKYKTPLEKADVEVVSLCAGDKIDFVTEADGTFGFEAHRDCDYYLVAKKQNFRDTLTKLSTFDVTADPCLEVVIPLSFDNKSIADLIEDPDLQLEAGMVIELYNIYFDLDKYFIRPDAVGDLEKVYQLMIKFPNMTGEIGAHTDSRAPHAYNVTLSHNRAKSAVKYLTNRGIDPSRLTWKGYGETVLKNECADGVPCTELQHQRNRRVEFKVTYFDGVVVSKEKYN